MATSTYEETVEGAGGPVVVGAVGEPDDSELVRRCLDGRREAYDMLMARHYRGVYNLVHRMLGNAQDASDLTQETFLRV